MTVLLFIMILILTSVGTNWKSESTYKNVIKRTGKVINSYPRPPRPCRCMNAISRASSVCTSIIYSDIQSRWCKRTAYQGAFVLALRDDICFTLGYISLLTMRIMANIFHQWRRRKMQKSDNLLSTPSHFWLLESLTTMVCSDKCSLYLQRTKNLKINR